MFSKVLIANRGEIAVRVIRTCRKLGIKTVSVYSEADRNALHARIADESCLIGGPLPSESYLNIGAILNAAKRSGAKAIHPGYGFLSQSPDFARACKDADIVFIGPAPEVMERVGDKLSARKLAREAGLPLIEGTDGPVDEANALDAARRLGFPLMVKAAAGGGGIGIHTATTPQELQQVLAAERRLAESAFGSSTLYLEQYVGRASHVEVQVLGDHHGNLIHLFERDCSVQRRNQKVIEETPCVKLTMEQRERILGYGLAFARHIGYTNAGTVEFLLSRDGRIYFLEMNTRIQVEHGITELVTGLDIVELQLRVAAGERLPLRQEDIHSRGHAIEARIYPEDPETYAPTVGVVAELDEPHAEHVRVDSALFPGHRITPYYEPVLAKAMAWGETRDEALERLYGWLRAYKLSGIVTNIPLVRRILTHPAFMAGDYDTGLLRQLAVQPPEASPGRAAQAEPDEGELVATIAAALVLGGAGKAAPSRHPGYSAWKHRGLYEQMDTQPRGGRKWR